MGTRKHPRQELRRILRRIVRIKTRTLCTQRKGCGTRSQTHGEIPRFARNDKVRSHEAAEITSRTPAREA